MCQDSNRVSMGVTPIRIKTRTRAKDNGTIKTIRTMDGGTIRIVCHLPQVNKLPAEKKADLEEALAQMLTSHTAFMNETKATQLNNHKA